MRIFSHLCIGILSPTCYFPPKEHTMVISMMSEAHMKVNGTQTLPMPSFCGTAMVFLSLHSSLPIPTHTFFNNGQIDHLNMWLKWNCSKMYIGFNSTLNKFVGNLLGLPRSPFKFSSLFSPCTLFFTLFWLYCSSVFSNSFLVSLVINFFFLSSTFPTHLSLKETLLTITTL